MITFNQILWRMIKVKGVRTLGFIVIWSIFSPATDAIFGYAYVLKFERQLVITCIAEVDRDERMDYLYCHST